MKPEKLTYGPEGFKEIKKFLEENRDDEYTLSIYNEMDQSTVEVICRFEEMVDVVAFVSNVEHDFPDWIGKNELSDSYVVGMNFTRGNIHTPSVCKWVDGKLKEMQE